MTLTFDLEITSRNATRVVNPCASLKWMQLTRWLWA